MIFLCSPRYITPPSCLCLPLDLWDSGSKLKRWIWKIERAILQWGEAVICIHLYSRFCLQWFFGGGSSVRFFSRSCLFHTSDSHFVDIFFETSFDPGISEQISKQMNANLTACLKIRWHFFHCKVSRRNLSGLLSPNFPPEPGLTL